MTNNTYSGTNIGVQGENASAGQVVFDQRTTAPTTAPEIDLKALAAELEELRPKARTQAKTLEHEEAVVALGHAEEAAKKGDASGRAIVAQEGG